MTTKRKKKDWSLEIINFAIYDPADTCWLYDDDGQWTPYFEHARRWLDRRAVRRAVRGMAPALLKRLELHKVSDTGRTSYKMSSVWRFVTRGYTDYHWQERK